MIIIIGAGLSGLITGYRLKIAGIPFKILEARNRLGGRINTVYRNPNTPVEMGATWFGAYHQNLMALLKELEIGYYEQYMKGTVFFQPFSTSPAQSIQMPSQPPSYRISGGTSHLIDTLYHKLDKSEVLLNQSVTEIKFKNDSVEVIATDAFECSHVVMAIPPKLWSKKIVFSPPIPNELKDIAQHTHTWMEDSIKVALTYAEPFWRQEQISGTLFSNTGPITEFYDHCNHDVSAYVLCGFINSSFKLLSARERRAKVLAQITTVFGAKAEEFIAYNECVWSDEEYTYETSKSPLFPHQNNGHIIFSNTFNDNRLFISSAEAALEFSGYMDGAVHSGNTTAKKLIDLAQSV